MRLLDTSTLKLCTFQEPELPEYIILSHTWVGEEEEVTSQELQSLNNALQREPCKEDRDQQIRGKKGYEKIVSFCRLAKEDGFQYAWVDTCCIDKTSSSELSEAINSMYRWYKFSRTCYVYLVDVTPVDYSDEEPLAQFKGSRWFRRGWTLQELLAPQQLKYFAQDWSLVGVTVRNTTCDTIFDSGRCICSSSFPGAKCLESEVAGSCGIRIEHLRKFDPQLTSYSSVCIAERMSWAAKRKTSRLEDMAYCLLGIFNINMPLIYGEGEKAFIRLQEEIIKHSVDRTILAWDRTDDRSIDQLLAPSPKYFKSTRFRFMNRVSPADEVHQITSQGLLTHLEVANHPNFGDMLVARLDHSHLFPPSGKPDYQILMVLPIVSHVKDVDMWTWISAPGEIYVHCPRELVAVNLALVQAGPWSFKRRKVCVVHWHPEHWKLGREEGILLQQAFEDGSSALFLFVGLEFLLVIFLPIGLPEHALLYCHLCFWYLIIAGINWRWQTLRKIKMASHLEHWKLGREERILLQQTLKDGLSLLFLMVSLELLFMAISFRGFIEYAFCYYFLYFGYFITAAINWQWQNFRKIQMVSQPQAHKLFWHTHMTDRLIFVLYLLAATSAVSMHLFQYMYASFSGRLETPRWTQSTLSILVLSLSVCQFHSCFGKFCRWQTLQGIKLKSLQEALTPNQ